MSTTVLNMPEILTIENDVVRSLANLVGTPVLVNGEKLTPEQWDELYTLRAVEHEHENGYHICLECQPEWFHFAKCSIDKKPLVNCDHNPRRSLTPAEWAAKYEANRPKVTKEVVNDETGEVEVVEVSGRGKRAKWLQEVPEELGDTITKEYEAGTSAIEVAKNHGIAQQAVYKFLGEKGILRAKGSKGRTPTTVEVTDAIVQKAIKHYNKGGSMVAFAKEQNVNPAKLSQAMKDAGCQVRKGKR